MSLPLLSRAQMWFLRNSCLISLFYVKLSVIRHTGNDELCLCRRRRCQVKDYLDRKLVNVTHIFRVSNVGHASRYAWPCKMSVFITYGTRFREFQSYFTCVLSTSGYSPEQPGEFLRCFIKKLLVYHFHKIALCKDIVTLALSRVPWARL